MGQGFYQYIHSLVQSGNLSLRYVSRVGIYFFLFWKQVKKKKNLDCLLINHFLFKGLVNDVEYLLFIFLYAKLTLAY